MDFVEGFDNQDMPTISSAMEKLKRTLADVSGNGVKQSKILVMEMLFYVSITKVSFKRTDEHVKELADLLEQTNVFCSSNVLEITAEDVHPVLLKKANSERQQQMVQGGK